MVVAIVIPIAILAALLFIGCFWWRRRQRKNREDVQEVNDSSNVFLFLKKIEVEVFICAYFCNCYNFTLLFNAVRRYLASEEESLRFDLATIEAATNSFSNEMKIGEGGFGAVYKV